MSDPEALNCVRCVTRIVILAVLTSVAGGAYAGTNVWTYPGPFGGDIYALAVDPTNSNIMYAGTYQRGMFKSTDAGATWSPINAGLPTLQSRQIGRAIAVSSSNPSIVWISSGAGVAKSLDGGAHWTPVSIPAAGFWSIAIDSTNPSIVYAGASDAVRKTTDGGATWQTIVVGSGGNYAVAVDPRVPATVYASGGPDSQHPCGAIFRSTDGGVSWQPLALNFSTQLILVDPLLDGVIYVAGTGNSSCSGQNNQNTNVWYTSDGGAHWAGAGALLANLTVNVYSMTLDTARGTAMDPGLRLIAGTGRGVWSPFAYTGAGYFVDWSNDNQRSRAVLAIPGQTLFFGGEGDGHPIARGGLFKTSLVSSPSPTLVTNSGIVNQSVTALAHDFSNALTVYAATRSDSGIVAADRGIFKSNDGGATWADSSSGLGSFLSGSSVPNVRSVATAPTDSNRVYAGTENGAWKSTDGGANWTSVNTTTLVPPGCPFTDSYRGIREIAVNPTNGDTVYAASTGGDQLGGGGSCGAAPGFFKSVNGGGSWTILPVDSSVTTAADGAGITIDPTNSAILYATIDSRLYRSADSGASWTRLSSSNALFPFPISQVMVDPTTPTTLYLGTTRYQSCGAGVFKSTDSGTTLISASTGLPVSTCVARLQFDPTSSSILYATSSITDGQAGDGGGTVYKSTDGAAHWGVLGATIVNGMTGLTILPTTPVTILAGTYGASVASIQQQAPTISSVTPATGESNGGTVVTIQGTNFGDGAAVTFAGLAATNVTVSSSTTLMATTPAHGAGLVDVTVSHSGGSSVTASGAFTYFLSAPSNLVATATAPAQVNLSWSNVTGATLYEIWRSSNNGAYANVGTSMTLSFGDSTGLIANTTYLYKVRALDGASNLSGFSNIDLATTIIFTDDPLVAGTTIVKATHLTQLRTAVNAVRAAAGLSSTTFTDSTLSSSITVSAIHIIELRSSLDSARAGLGLSALSYTDPTITAASTLIKAVHIQQLRSGVK